MLPLFQAMKGKLTKLVWVDAMRRPFQLTKKLLVGATLLTHPRQDAQLSLTTVASDLAVGAVLQQLVDGTWIPLVFFSQKLRPPERKYSTFDCELLALYLRLRHFSYYLEGRQFVAYTDHKPLIYCMSKCTEP